MLTAGVGSGLFLLLAAMATGQGTAPGDAGGGHGAGSVSKEVGVGGSGQDEPGDEADGSKMVKLTLESTHESGKPGQGFWLGAVFQIEPRWHTYWKNAGDSGAPPRFEWTVEPAGALEIGGVEWMVPERKVSPGDILDYIYEGRVTHFFPVKIAESMKPGDTIKITCTSTWLVCKDACLPGEGRATLTLRVGGSQESSAAAGLRAQRELVPMEADELLKIGWSRTGAGGGGAGGENGGENGGEAPVLEVVFTPATKGASLSYFPYADEGDLVPVNLLRGGASKTGTLRLRFDPKEMDSTQSRAPKRVRGVVRVDSPAPAGTRAYLLDVPTPGSRE